MTNSDFDFQTLLNVAHTNSGGTKTDDIAQAIEQAITSGTLPAGTRFPPEQQLAKQLNISRSTLRDALQRLEARELIERKPKMGTRVRHVQDTMHADTLVEGLGDGEPPLLHTLEVRMCLEPSMAALSAQKASELDIKQLERLERRMSDPLLSLAQFSVLDQLFHRTIALATHNPMLVQLFDRITEILALSRSDQYLTKARQQSSTMEHQAIFEAIREHDPIAAEQAAHHHIDSIRQRLIPDNKPE